MSVALRRLLLASNVCWNRLRAAKETALLGNRSTTCAVRALRSRLWSAPRWGSWNELSHASLASRTTRVRCFSLQAPLLLRAGARLSRAVLLSGVIAGPNERPRLDPREPHRFAGGLPFGELLGRHVARHRDLQRARPQVLADREQLTPGVSEVLHGLHDFAGLLAHSDDDVRLRVRGRRERCARALQELERALVREGRTDALDQSRHGLDVVRQDVGLRVDD